MKNTDKATHFPIRDENGTDYLCPIDAVENQNAITDQEFDECVEEDVVRRYSGNVTVQAKKDNVERGADENYSI